MIAKKIVMILSNYFNPDPRVYKEARYLVSRGFDVTILCWYREDVEGLALDEDVDGIRVIRYRIPSELGSGKKQIPAFIKYIKCCRKYLQENHADYLHCNDLDGVIVGWLSRKRKTHMVFDMHEFYEDVGEGKEVKRRIKRGLTKFFINKSVAAIRTNDLYLRPEYKRQMDKMFLLKNLPDPNLIQALPKTASNKFRIAYHGCVRGQMHEFLTLFNATADMTDVSVDIWGGGPDLIKLRDISPNYPNVVLHGFFDGARELTKLYSETDVEYLGYRRNSETRDCQEVVKYFECIVTGTPMILTDAYTKMGNEIVSKSFGIICDTLNVEQVRQAILKLKNDTAFWKSCSNNELAHSDEYNWNEAVRVLDKIYT